MRLIWCSLVLLAVTLACQNVKKVEAATEAVIPLDTIVNYADSLVVEGEPLFYVTNNIKQALHRHIPNAFFTKMMYESPLDSLFTLTRGPYTVVAVEEPSALDKIMFASNTDKDSISWLLRQVIPGDYDSRAIYQGFSAVSSEFSVKTLSGESVILKIQNDSLLMQLPHGNRLYLKTTDIITANGVLHIATLID